MNEVHDTESKPAKRLTNLIYTDPLAHLPLPQVPQPPSASSIDTSAATESSLLSDASFLERAATLLQTADVSYIEARGPVLASTATYGPLHAALAARDPAIFDAAVTYTGPALPPLQRRHLSQTAAQHPGLHEAAAVPPQRAETAQEDSAHAGNSVGASDNETLANGTHPVPKKRKRSARKPAHAAPIAFDAKDEAGNFQAALAAFLARAAAGASAAAGAAAAGSDAAASEEPSQPGNQRGPQQAARELRGLADAVSRARASKVLQQADAGQLRQLMAVLTATMRDAAHATLSPAGDEDSDTVATIMTALDAAVAALHVAAAPDMPRGAVPEEALEQACGLLRHHLLHNVLAFHDARLQQLHRPHLLAADAYAADEAQAGSARKRQKASQKAPSSLARIPEAVAKVLGRIEAALGLLAQLLFGTGLPAESLIPLLRAAAAALTVERLDLLHVQASGLLVAAFCNAPQQRTLIMDELVGGVLPNAVPGRIAARAAAALPESSPPLHIVTSLVLQLLQVIATLPAMDVAPEAMHTCFSPAIAWAERFWHSQLDRMSSSGTKTEADGQSKLWVERVVADLLSVLNCPEWPAASLLLTRFIGILNGNRGLTSANAGVRQMAVDLLGSIAAALCADKDAAEADAAWLRDMVSQADDTEEDTAVPDAPREDTLLAAHKLLLKHLALTALADDSIAATATGFRLCRALFDEVCALQKLHAGEQELREALLAHRRLSESLHEGAVADLSFPEAVRLGRALVQVSSLGRSGSSHILKWLLACVDPGQQGAMVRCKAVKALKAVVQASMPVLALPEVQDGVSRALQDEAVSVREAVVDLLGRHIGDSAELAAAYLDMLIAASRDAGTSVRKRALTILWESCIRPPGFPQASEACVAVLQRCADSEESVRDLVAKVFQGLWFAPDVGKSAAQRAAQLAEVAAAVYDGGGAINIRLPLESEHPLVQVMTTAVRKEQSGKGRRSAGAVCGEALLEAVLAAHEIAEAAIPRAFPPLLALHALAMADPQLCIPSRDPARFVRCLAPYLKDEAGVSKELQRRAAESLLCIMSLLSAVLPRLEHLDRSICAELEGDLARLVQRHVYTQVVQAACRTLANLARLSAKAGATLVRLAAHSADRLAGAAESQAVPIQAAQAPAGSLLELITDAAAPAQQLNSARINATRTLFVLGHLARSGADIIDAAAEEAEAADGPAALTLERCLDILVAFHTLPTGGDRVADGALHSLGALFIARPGFMLLEAPAGIMRAALAPAAPAPLKNRALLNLTELLKADEARLLAQQAAAGGKGVGDARSGGVEEAALKAQPDAAAAALAVQNGEGESLGVSSGVLQDNWAAVLELATDAGPADGLPAEVAQVGLVRRRVRDLIEAVLRGGLVAPWTAVPALVALATDPQRDVADASLRLLRRQAEVHRGSAGLLHTRMAEGIPLAHAFHLRLAVARPSPDKRGGHNLQPELAAGAAALYTQLVQPQKGTRSSFLSSLLRRFDTAACLVTRDAATDLELLSCCAQIVAALPFKKADEPLGAIMHINNIIAKRGEAVLAAFKAALKQAEAALGTPAAADGGATSVGLDDTPAAQLAASAGGAAATPTAAQQQAPPAAEAAAAGLAEACDASLAVSMLLQLKQFLLRSYSLAPERAALYASASSEKKRQEEKLGVSVNRGVPSQLGRLHLDASADLTRTWKQFKLFKELMKEDTPGHLGGLDAVGDAAAGDGTPATNGAGDVRTPDSGPATGATGGKGKRRATSTLGKQRPSRLKRQRQAGDSDDEGDGDYRPGGGKGMPRQLAL